MERNVLLLSLDTVRKDYFERYATRLRELADLEFEQWRSASCSTVPSHFAMFTGEHPYELSNQHFDSLSKRDTFLSDLGAAGTVCVNSAPVLGDGSGFAELFDESHEIRPYRRFARGLNPREYSGKYFHFLTDALRDEAPTASLRNGVAAKLYNLFEDLGLPSLVDSGTAAEIRQIQEVTQRESEPFFAYANIMEAHAPLRDFIGYRKEIADPPRGWDSSSYDAEDIRYGRGTPDRVTTHASFLETYRAVYAAAIDYVDRLLSEALTAIQRSTRYETTVIITADHGEGLGYASDAYHLGHLNSLAESVVNVPCLLLNPPEGVSEEEGFYSHRQLEELIRTLATDESTVKPRNHCTTEFVCDIEDDGIPAVEQELVNRVIRSAYRNDEKVIWDSLGQWGSVELADDDAEVVLEPRSEPVPTWATSLFATTIRD